MNRLLARALLCSYAVLVAPLIRLKIENPRLAANAVGYGQATVADPR